MAASDDFSRKLAEALAEPSDRKVEVHKLELDLSISGLLNRIHALLEAAHDRGALGAGDYEEASTGLNAVKRVLSPLDASAQRRLLKSLTSDPNVRLLTRPRR